MEISKLRTAGMDANTVDMIPTMEYASAQNGSASGSLLVSDAVPKPPAVDAAARPRAIVSLMPTAVINWGPKFAPRRPTSLKARE